MMESFCTLPLVLLVGKGTIRHVEKSSATCLLTHPLAMFLADNYLNEEMKDVLSLEKRVFFALKILPLLSSLG